MKYLLIFILSIPNILNSQIITDHNLEWTLNNNPLFAKTTYELKLRYDYVMDKSKGDTITRLSFDIKEVNETVGGKINSQGLMPVAY